MSQHTQFATDTRFLYFGTRLLLFVATVHLIRGTVGLLDPTDAYPITLLIAFIAFGIAGYVIAIGIEATLLPPMVAYLAGVGLVLCSFAGYADVHVFGVMDALAPLDVSPDVSGHTHSGHSHAHSHAHANGEGSAVQSLSEHLTADPTALLLKSAEFAVMVSLAVAALRHGVD